MTFEERIRSIFIRNLCATVNANNVEYRAQRARAESQPVEVVAEFMKDILDNELQAIEERGLFEDNNNAIIHSILLDLLDRIDYETLASEFIDRIRHTKKEEEQRANKITVEVDCPVCAKRFAGHVLTEMDASLCCEECYEVWSAFPDIVD